jgi:flagellar biosynthesis/type III secretory pathway protein FliH
MSEVLKAIEVNCTTGEVTERPLTAEEILDREAQAAAAAIEQAEREAEATATAEAKASGIAKLLALGLTESEANALIK